MIGRLVAALMAGGAVALVAIWLRPLLADGRGFAGVRARQRRLAGVLRGIVEEGRVDRSFGSRRLLVASVLLGGLLGFALLGGLAAVAGACAAPFVVRAAIRSRRRRYAARIDACTPELAEALASALAAGRSVRGALLSVGRVTPEPLATELDRAVVELTLGGSVGDLLADLRSRTGSPRIESLAGAIELHRGSGGDLVKLTRELAEAFRERDRALRDAQTASAQARFTAYVVAAIPVGVLAMLELAAPGSIGGALSLLPSALMLCLSLALLVLGVVLCRRLGAVRA